VLPSPEGESIWHPSDKAMPVMLPRSFAPCDVLLVCVGVVWVLCVVVLSWVFMVLIFVS
jgi:hypothetical protein